VHANIFFDLKTTGKLLWNYFWKRFLIRIINLLWAVLRTIRKSFANETSILKWLCVRFLCAT